ncbi:MAG: nitrogen fixation protein NifH [Lentisphaerae bacterium]|nr:nitrogen fixation protein NifH [Lentisphaerota bacterium]
MLDWKSMLTADTMKWLLEEENPSVRYYTLKDILDKSEHEPEVQQAKREIMKCGIVPDILRKQQEPSYLKTYSDFYTEKYKGLVWQLIVLAQMGAESNSQIIEQCEYLLNISQEAADGGFSMHTAVKKSGGRIAEVIPCLTGNMVWSLIHFGYVDDPRLQRAVDWITRFMRLNDGNEDTPQIPPYDRYEMCWGKHTCFMGAVKALKGLSGIPQGQRTSEINDTINKVAEFLLIHRIYKRSHDLSKVSKPGWLKFSFPLMYQTDVLEISEILTGLGITDSRMNDAIDVITKKQDDMGRWRIENTSNTDRLLFPLGEKGEQSKWITLRAIRVLKRYNAGS